MGKSENGAVEIRALAVSKRYAQKARRMEAAEHLGYRVL